MPEQFTRATERFRVNGVDLNNPLDSLRPGYYPLLENVRSFTDGVLQPRQGLTVISTVVANKTPVHSVRRLTDPINSNWVRIVGAGDALAYGQGAFTQATYNGSNVQYDGNPLILTPFRPDQAISPFMYIAAQTGHNIGSSVRRQLKINSSGTVHQWGLPPPLAAPTVELGNVSTNGNAVIGQASIVAMTVDGTVATGASTPNRVDAATISVTAIIFDSGSSGWCSVVPSSLADIGAGMIVQFSPIAGHDVVRVAETFVGGAATTIGAINYLSGTTGECVIAPATPTPEMVKNAVVQVDVGGSARYYRILSAINGPDGSISIRVNTGANAHTTTTALQVVGSFRTTATAVDIATDPLSSIARDAAFALSGTDSFGYFSSAVTRDLTKIPSGDGIFTTIGMFMSDDDYFHSSIWCSDWSKLSSGRVVFNVDPTENPTWSTGKNYSLSNNFYYRQFTSNDLTPESQGKQSPIDSTVARIQHNLIERGIRPSRLLDDAGDIRTVERPIPDQSTITPITPPSTRSQVGTGSNQWAEIRFTKGECTRVGNKSNGDWSSSRHIVFEFVVSGSCHIRVNSMSAWGGAKPDIGDLGSPYQYRYRYRVSSTGAVSNWSPPSLNGVAARRQTISITTTTPTNTPEVDRVDIERLGGSLTNWTYIGTINASSGTFTDTYGDDDIVSNVALSEGDTNYQPWPTKGAPVSGIAATSNATSAGVAGTLLRDSSTSFNQSWAKGTSVRINGVDTAIRRVHSTSLLEVDDSLGSQSAVIWEIPEPLVFGTPLYGTWIWNDRGFACGDPNNPGYLYFSNGNSLDTTQDTNYLELTSPAEPLMNGISFNGKNYVWSTERMFEIEQLGPDQYIGIEIPGRKGLVAAHGICVGERLWFVSRDGIYQTGGGDSISITDETLKPFFVKEGNVGINVNGFYPPDFTAPNNIRLSYYDGYLYFTYKDTNGSLRTLVYTVHAEKPGWWPDTYLDGRGVTYIYGEEGAVFTSQKVSSAVHSLLACGNDVTTGKLYQVTGTTDGASPITSHVRTQYFDAQDRRAEKRWGDFILDADPNAATLNLTLYQNNATSTTFALTPATMTGSGRTQQIIDLASGGDPTTDYSRNVALDIAWTSSLTPQLFLWEPAYTLRPETTDLRSTSWDTAGFEGDKFFQGIEIDADTGGVARTIQIEYDGASTNVGATLTVNHTNRQLIAYSFPAAFIAGTVRLRPTDGANSWKLYNYEWKYQPEPPLGLRWESQQTSFGVDEFLHMKAMYVTVRSTDVVTVTITRTDDSTTQSYTIASTANARKKVYLPLAVTKGKAFSFVFSSPTPFRLYKSDTVVLIKPWASEEQFSNRNVFGAEHGNGAVPI